jgi:hypothetical protein
MYESPVMMRHFIFVWTILLMLASAACGADSIWLEGEEPTSKNVEVKAVGWGRTELLSGGKWLLLQIEQQAVAKKLPKEGALLGYQFQVSSAGSYEVWSRIGWEGIRSPFAWSMENELTLINARNFGLLKQVEPRITRAAKAVMAMDPTRPAMIDGGNCLSIQSLPVNGSHYIESSITGSGIPLRDYPDQAYTWEKIVENEKQVFPLALDRRSSWARVSS